MAETNDDAAIETEAPKTDESGFTLAGDWPLNHRLRAEAMAREGVAEDPDGHISPELIADTAARLDAEEAAAKEAEKENPPLDKMTRAQLEAAAAAEPFPVDLSSASTNADRVRLIEESRAARASTGV